MPSEKLAAVCKSPIKTEIEMGCTQQDAFAVAPNITHPSPLPRGLLLALCTGLGARRGSTESSGAPALTAVPLLPQVGVTLLGPTCSIVEAMEFSENPAPSS